MAIISSVRRNRTRRGTHKAPMRAGSARSRGKQWLWTERECLHHAVAGSILLLNTPAQYTIGEQSDDHSIITSVDLVSKEY